MKTILQNLNEIQNILKNLLHLHKSHRVCICFFGLIRYGKKTIPSIEKNILNQLKKFDIDYDVYLHTYDLTVVNCPRNNENNVKIDNTEWRNLHPFSYKVTNQQDFDRHFDFNWFSQYGWTQGVRNKESFYNMFRQMNSLKEVTNLWEQKNRYYDLYLYFRPDMEYVTPLLVEDLFQYFNQPNVFLLPPFGNTEKGGQYCDFYAIGCKETMRIYGNRMDYAYDFITEGGGIYKQKQFHTESFVFYIAKRFGWKYKEIKDFYGYRCRANGKIYVGYFIAPQKLIKRNVEQT